MAKQKVLHNNFICLVDITGPSSIMYLYFLFRNNVYPQWG